MDTNTRKRPARRVGDVLPRDQQQGEQHHTDVHRSATPLPPGAALLAAPQTDAPSVAHPSAHPASSRAAQYVRMGGGALRRWLSRRDRSFWLIIAIAALALIPRLYGLNWDANNHLHPDEREIVFKSMCLSLPGTPRGGNCDPAVTGFGWFFSPSSPLNPHFFAYGSFPLYLLAGVAHALAWLTHVTGGRFRPPDGGAWDDFNHFTLVGRVISALFDTGSVLVAGLIARRLAGRWASVLATAFVATIPFAVQVSHYYAVDTLLTFFVMLTLFGCVLLAQGPRHAERIPDSATFWQAWRVGALIGASFGLAMATKVSALPLLAPIAVALALRWRRRGLEETALAMLGVGAVALIVFLVTSPYTVIDWQSFQAQVHEQTALSQGQLDYPYVRQFTNTTPFVYEIQQLLFYDMGIPLGLLGLTGFVWAAARLWRRLDDDWAIMVIWLAGYFAVVGSAYTKFTRYMLPTFAPLAICGAAALAAFAVWGARRFATGAESTARRQAFPRIPLFAARETGNIASWWRVLCCALAGLTLASSLLLTLALVNVYSAPNTRAQASEWIYNHIPAGEAITYEIWDDPLPIQVPAARTGANGQRYTAAGHTINPYQYSGVGLDLYAPDNAQKAQTLANQLATSSVVVISSQRLLRSIPKLPDRYPLTIHYYQLLFAGKLGFTLKAHFENAPHFLGFTLNEGSADESFSVYDHPPVWVFVKTGQPLTPAQLDTVLTQGVTLPATSNRSGSQKSLLLPAQDAAADAQSQAIGQQFPASSLPNHIPIMWWLLLIELLGLISFPLAYFVFPGLHDRGWGLSKMLGMLLLAYLVWLPASLRLAPFTQSVVVAVFALLALIGLTVAWLRRTELLAFVRTRWRLLVLCEALFLVAFLYFTWVRALDPDLWHIYRGGEKPMEFAYLNAILRSRYFPPYDPWFSGGYINYYYYGQYLFAVLIKLTGIAPATAFNLSIPLLFGVTFSGAFSVVSGMAKRWWAGVAGGIALLVVGNLQGFQQLLTQWGAIVTHQVAPAFDYWASSRVIPYTINEFPYWSFLYADLHAHVIDLPIVVFIIAGCASLLGSARSLTIHATRSAPSAPEQQLEPVGVSNLATSGWNESPPRDGSSEQGDTRRPRQEYSNAPSDDAESGDDVSSRGWRRLTTVLRDPRGRLGGSGLSLPTLAALALALGAAWCTSTWDVPTYGLLIAAALALRYFAFGAGRDWSAVWASFTWPNIRNYVVALALTFAATYALYLPFHSHFQLLVSGTGPVATPTDPRLFFVLFGLWLFLLVTFFFLELRDRVDSFAARMVEGESFRSPLRTVILAFIFGFVLLLAVAVSLKSALFLLIALGLFLGLNPRHSPIKLLTFALLVLGLAVAFGVELIYIRDFLDNSPWERMNTVFKFYYQVWTLFALGGALIFAQLLPRVLGSSVISDDVADTDARDTSDVDEDEFSSAPPAASWTLPSLVPGALRTGWLAALLALTLVSSVFLVEGTQVRVQDPTIWAAVQAPPNGVQPQGLSLDGMAFMRGWYPADYDAITWVNNHIAGDPTIVEASNGNYQWYSRVSVYTGLPDVLGWGNREFEQRYGDEVFPRQSDVQNFWATEDPQAALAFLRQYHVSYIYFGGLERTCYVTQNDVCEPMTSQAIAKFQTLTQLGALTKVYDNTAVYSTAQYHDSGVIIYKVSG